jgi:hypothetical protein
MLVCFLVFAATAAFNLQAPQPQGRLLFPAIAPAAILVAAGLVRVSARLPHRRYAIALLPLTALIVLFAWFRPAFDPALAPAPVDHRSLVGGIVHATVAPSIEWRDVPAPEPLDAPPSLRWSDPEAPAGTRYTLYAFDAAGRVWLATHEWTHGGLVIDGDAFELPDAVWSFLPRGVDLSLVLRRVPATDSERPADLPRSAPVPLHRR